MYRSDTSGYGELLGALLIGLILTYIAIAVGFEFNFLGLVSYLGVSIIAFLRILSIAKTGNYFRIDSVFWLVVFVAYVLSPIVLTDTQQYYPLIQHTNNWFVAANLYLGFGFLVILLYAFLVRYFSLEKKETHAQLVYFQSSRVFELRHRKLLWFFLVLSFLAQASIYVSAGGIIGYIESFTLYKASEIEGFSSGSPFALILAESFPYLLVVFFVSGKKTHFRSILKNRWGFYGFLIFLCLVAILFGGLRGSRSSVILFLFWAMAFLHYSKVYTPKKMDVLVLVFFVAFFMASYSFYKSYGKDAVSQISYASVVDNKRYGGNALTGILLGDFSRYEVQTNLIDSLVFKERELWLGQSLANAILLPFPTEIRGLFKSKVELGTNTLYGPNSYSSGWAKSSFIYGLVGEWFANFYIFGVFFSSLILFIVRYLFSGAYVWSLSAASGSTFIPIVSFFPILLVNFFMSDLSNFVFYAIKNLSILCVILIASRSIRND